MTRPSTTRTRTRLRTLRRRFQKRFLPRLTGWKRRIVFAVAGFFIFFFLLFGLAYAFARIPEPNEISTAQSAIVYDQHGHIIGRIHSDADRVSIKLKDMPLDLQHAVVATEDRTFYSNPGISIGGILRAGIADIFGGHQGGSTITQQYVKNAFVGNKRSFIRKAREAIISLKLDHQRSKDQILEDYLNTIYFGRGAYGVEAAAEAYFGKHARSLSLPESAMLAGLIRAPSYYDPIQQPKAAKARRDIVLDLMVHAGYLTQDKADAAKRARLPAARHAVGPGGPAPHYLDDVRKILEEKLGARALYTGGVKVYATLDLGMQQAADEAVHSVFDRPSDPDAVLVSIDPHTGAVRAMVGARDYATRQLNIAMHAFRQPGSAFKPATLATYVDEGRSIKDRYKAPATITLHPPNSEPFEVSNYDHSGHGTLTVEQGTWLSVNTVYAQMILKADPVKVAYMANRLGIQSTLHPFPSLALGTSEVSPIELASMYATFAARGVYNEPYLVEKVVDSHNRVLLQAQLKPEQVVSRNVADTVNFVLQGVIRNGTGRSAQIGRPEAGKTGTTEDHRDAWFAGYTPELTTVVWNGYAGKFKLMNNVRGIAVVGASFPAEMWRLFMERALADLPATSFATPELTSPSPTATSSPSPSPSPTPTPTPTPTPSSTPVPSPSNTPKPKPSKTPSPSPSPSAVSSP